MSTTAYLYPTDAAKILGISRQRVHKLIDDNRILATPLDPGKPGSPLVIDRRSFATFKRKYQPRKTS